jgi:flagellar hook-associated protein 2
MSSNGIDLSSLLSALGSSSSGINVASAVAQAMVGISAPQRHWQAQQQDLQNETTLINQIQSHVSALQDALNALGDPVGGLTSMVTTSSDQNVVVASATAGTAAGSHVVIVDHIASTASWYSNAVASGSTTLTPGSFSLQVGSNPATQIQIGNGVDTLDQLAASINTQNLGVTASVINDSTGSRLAIVSNSAGAANGVTISAASGLTFTQASVGQDASLTVDGIPIDSASNTINGVIAGLTLNVVGAAPGGQVTVTISPDSNQIAQSISDFVKAYNTVIADVNNQFALNGNNQQGPLAGDAALRMLQSNLLSMGSYSVSGGVISTLGDLGIHMNNDGTLKVDTSVLGDVVQTKFAAVRTFMQGTASNGFASFLNNQLNTLTDATDGAFTVDLQSISNENKNLQDQIDNFQTYLDAQRALLTQQYNKANILLQQLPLIQAQIDAQLGNTPKKNS